MLKASLRKIRSALNHTWVRVVIGVAAVLLILWAVVLAAGPRSDAPKADYLLRTRTQTYKLEEAATLEKVTLGLSGRKNMAQDAGMLFVFADDSEECFWMKDMRFPLDIIWVDSNKRVTHIERNLSPSTYPKQFCATAQYVIELNAGQAARSDISEGAKLDF